MHMKHLTEITAVPQGSNWEVSLVSQHRGSLRLFARTPEKMNLKYVDPMHYTEYPHICRGPLIFPLILSSRSTTDNATSHFSISIKTRPLCLPFDRSIAFNYCGSRQGKHRPLSREEETQKGQPKGITTPYLRGVDVATAANLL